MDSRKIVIKETAAVAVGILLLTGGMVGIYAALGLFRMKVLYSALAGAVVIVMNHLFMSITANLAADRAQAGDVAQAQKMIQTSSAIRLLVMAGLLLLGILLGAEVLALVLPLLFHRPVLMVWSFFSRKEDA